LSTSDDLADITLKFRLELQATLAIEQQILRQPCPILPEPLVQLIVTHSFEPIPNDVEEVVEMRLILVVIEFTTGFFQFGAFGVALRLEDETRLQEEL
jgi:hypothetical protein